jgi:uncharacterized protein YjdB
MRKNIYTRDTLVVNSSAVRKLRLYRNSNEYLFLCNIQVVSMTDNGTLVPVTAVVLNQSAASMEVSQTLQLKATIKPFNASVQTVTWSSSDNEVATVDDNGVVTAIAAGNATITASCDGQTATCVLTITGEKPVTSITLDETTLRVAEGKYARLTATVLPTDASQALMWTSSDESVATVSQSGLVSAVAAGNAVITATTTDGTDLSASCDVTVLQVQAESIQLNVTTAGLNEGSTLQLTATVLPEECDIKTVIWASNNPSVATVDSNGLVTTHSVGTATITAITTDGSNLSTTCTVTLLPVGVKGDMNDDGEINIADINAVIGIILSGTEN